MDSLPNCHYPPRVVLPCSKVSRALRIYACCLHGLYLMCLALPKPSSWGPARCPPVFHCLQVQPRQKISSCAMVLNAIKFTKVTTSFRSVRYERVGLFSTYSSLWLKNPLEILLADLVWNLEALSRGWLGLCHGRCCLICRPSKAWPDAELPKLADTIAKRGTAKL
jgi:hypothetical protein